MASGTIRVGDEFAIAGAPSQVIEVIHTTDASGVVTFAEADVALTVQQSAGVALASVSDTNFCAFVLQGIDETAKYAVGVYHPELGLRIAPSPMSIKPIGGITIAMGFACPEITIEHDGVAQADEYVTFTVERQTTADQLVGHIYGADRFTNTGSNTFGEWMTSSGTGGGWNVAGAGDANCNGDYTADGALNGKAKYVNSASKYIFWSSGNSCWCIGDVAGEIAYYTGTGADLPANAWATEPGWGTDPAPTVSGSEASRVGVVKHNRADGSSLQQIYFPFGEGALFQREGDLRDDEADKPDEYAATVWCYHRGDRVRVVEGEAVTLNWTTGSIAFTGTPGAKAYPSLEDVHTSAVGTYVILDGSGEGTVAGLTPGYYVCEERPADDNWRSMAVRTSCQVTAGATTNVTLPALASPPAGKNWLDIYDYEDTPISGDLYAETVVAGDPANPVLIASGSRIEFAWADFAPEDPRGVVFIGDTAFQVIPTSPQSDRTCYQATARARGILTPSGGAYLVWWEGTTPHRDLMWDSFKPPFILRERDGRQSDVAFEGIPRGVRSGLVHVRPAPTWDYTPDPPLGFWDWGDANYEWDVVDPEGTLIWDMTCGSAGGLYGPNEITDKYGLQLASVRDRGDYLVGGKLSGDIVDGHFTRIHSGNLTEANRYGLEWGDWQRCGVRVLSGDGGTDNVRAGCITGNTCPSCYGPVWRWPSVGGYVYGYCAQTGCKADARTWIRAPSVGGGGYDVRVLRYRPGKLSYRLLDKWLRPVDYIENGGNYVTCTHPTLATWELGVFTDGDDNAAIAATNSLTNTVYVQPKIVPTSISEEATYTISCTMADGRARDFTVSLQAGLDKPQQITTRAKVDPADAEGVATPADCDFIADVTNITSSLEEDLNTFLVVADVPAFIDAQTPIAELTQTPWACQFLSLFGQPDTDVGRIDGITHLVWADDGSIYYSQVDDGLEGWRYGALEPEAGRVQKKLVMDGATTGPWDNPSVTRLPTDRIVVTGHDRGRAKTVAYVTWNQGETWEAVGMLGEGLTLVNAKADRSGVIHAAGYSGGSMWYQRSDDEGETLCEFGEGGTVREVSLSDAQQPGIVPMPDGRVVVVVALNNVVRPMVSSNGGETWAVADTLA